jgi:outer membrane immunogenic protein
VAAGGQAGCDYQTGALVVGAEGMFDWTNADGDNVTPAGTVRAATDQNWFATATARIGYSFDRSLIYVKGGGAWVNESWTQLSLAGVVANSTGNFTRSGWVVGGGWEYAFAPSWSMKVEYNYFDLGNRDQNTCAGGACAPIRLDQTAHLVLLGLNYRFGGM